MSKNPYILHIEEKQNAKKDEAHSHEKNVEKEVLGSKQTSFCFRIFFKSNEPLHKVKFCQH